MLRIEIKNNALRSFKSDNNQKISEIMQSAFATINRKVTLFSVGATHTHKFTNRQELYIFNYSSLRDTNIKPQIHEIDGFVAFGRALDVKRMIEPYPGGMLINTDEGQAIAQYFPEHHIVNIFVDLLETQDEHSLHVFKMIMHKVGDIIREEGDIDSWVRAKDKTFIKGKTQSMFKAQFDARTEAAKSALETFTRKAEEYRQSLTNAYNKIAENMRLLEDNGKAFDDYIGKILADMDLLAQFDKVEDLRIEGEFIHIYTTDLIIVEPQKQRQYRGGKFIIKVRLSDSTVTFHSATGTGHRGYWTNNDPHPHVSGGSGVACLGSTSATIAELCSKQEVFALGIVLISFLEAVNIDDSAGRKVVNWPLITGDAIQDHEEDEDNEGTDGEEEPMEDFE